MVTFHLPTHRRVVRATRAGAPDVLEITTETLSPLKPGEVLVRVEAAGLNHVDSLARSGTYAIRFAFPFDVGVEGAGTVVASGPDVAMAPGTRVCWTAVFGSCATYVVAPADMLAELPARLSVEAGASLAHAGITAAGLVRHAPLQDGQTAVVWAAAGAVGRLLVALLAARGVSVIGIASGARTHQARAAGAAQTVDRSCEDVVERVKAYTDGRGATAAFDPVGAATYPLNLRLLEPRGYLVNYGQLSGALPSVDLSELMDAGSIFVTKYGPRAGVVRRDQLASFLGEALTLATSRPLVSDVAGRFSLDRVAEAYRALDSGVSGKVLVRPHGDA